MDLLSAAAAFAQAPGDPAVFEACGAEPGAACRLFFDVTGSVTATKAFDLLVTTPLNVAVILVIAYVAHRLVQRGVSGLVSRMESEQGRRPQRAETVGGVVRSVAFIAIWVIALITVFDQVGLPIGPVLAGVGILGVALGFGAQGLVSDVVSGLFMIIEDQYGQGDVIDAGDAVGVVEGVGLRTTSVRDLNGLLWHVRNGQIMRVANMSQDWGRAVVDVDVSYDTDLDRAFTAIKAVADDMRGQEEFADVLLDEPEIWGVQELGADSVTIRLVVTTQPSRQFGIARELRRRLKMALDSEGIEIPFPQRTLWLRTDATGAEQPPLIDVRGGGVTAEAAR